MRKNLPNWRITIISGNRAKEIGTVSAADADSGVKVAIKECAITDPERQMQNNLPKFLTRDDLLTGQLW